MSAASPWLALFKKQRANESKRMAKAINKTPEGLKQKSKEIFDMERKLDKLYAQRREIITYLELNKTIGLSDQNNEEITNGN